METRAAAAEGKIVAKEPGSLKPTMTPEAGFRRIAQLCCDAFAEHLAGVMTSTDPEGPHKARVALRRFRSALVGFAPVIDKTARSAMAGDARDLFRILGRLRDADVRLATCIDPTAIAGLARDADQARIEVRQAMTQAHAAGFPARIKALLAGDSWVRVDDLGRRWKKRGLDRLARRALYRSWQDCQARGTDLVKLPFEERHELRKDLKTLRYLAEYFAPFWPGSRRDRFLDHLRQVQDHLGLLNDLTLMDAANPTPPDPDAEAALLAASQKSWKSLVRAGAWWG